MPSQPGSVILYRYFRDGEGWVCSAPKHRSRNRWMGYDGQISLADRKTRNQIAFGVTVHTADSRANSFSVRNGRRVDHLLAPHLVREENPSTHDLMSSRLPPVVPSLHLPCSGEGMRTRSPRRVNRSSSGQWGASLAAPCRGLPNHVRRTASQSGQFDLLLARRPDLTARQKRPARLRTTLARRNSRPAGPALQMHRPRSLRSPAPLSAVLHGGIPLLLCVFGDSWLRGRGRRRRCWRSD